MVAPLVSHTAACNAYERAESTAFCPPQRAPSPHSTRQYKLTALLRIVATRAARRSAPGRSHGRPSPKLCQLMLLYARREGFSEQPPEIIAESTE